MNRHWAKKIEEWQKGGRNTKREWSCEDSISKKSSEDIFQKGSEHWMSQSEITSL